MDAKNESIQMNTLNQEVGPKLTANMGEPGIATSLLSVSAISLNNVINTLNAFIGGIAISHLKGADERYSAAGGNINTAQECLFVSFRAILFSVMINISIEKSKLDALRRSPIKKVPGLERIFKTEEEHIQDINEFAQAGTQLALLLSIPACICSLILSLSMSEEFEKPYFLWLTAALPFMLLLEVPRSIAFAMNKHALHLGMQTLNLLTLGLGICFMRGLFFFPEMSIPGLATGYLVSHVINLLVYAKWFQYRPEYADYTFATSLATPRWKALKSHWRLGWPISMHVFSDLFSVFMLMVFAGLTSEPKQAQSMDQAISQFAYLFIIIQVGLTNASSEVAGRLFGQGPAGQEKIRFRGTAIITLGFCIAAIIFGLSLKYARSLSRLYITEDMTDWENMLDQLETSLPTMLLIQCSDAIGSIESGLLRGIGDSKSPMVTSVITQLGISMVCAGIGLVLFDSLEAILLGYSVGINIRTVVLTIRFINQTTTDALNARARRTEPETIKELLPSCSFFSCNQENEATYPLEHSGSFYTKLPGDQISTLV